MEKAVDEKSRDTVLLMSFWLQLVGPMVFFNLYSRYLQESV
jgi:hypothetical protein